MLKKIVYGAVGVLIVLVLAFVGFKVLKPKGKVLGVSASEGYSAVFLSNGQVYFGKLSNINSDWVELNDIYYLQVQQQVQPKPEGEETQTQKQSQLSLVKLGNELHGPQDKMTINNKHVLFYESLKDEGKVAQSIQKYIEEQNNKSSNSGQTTEAPADTNQ